MILPACYDGNEREGLQASDIPNELWLYHIVRNKIFPLEKANDIDECFYRSRCYRCFF